MARSLRIEYPGAFYHVMNRGLERREIFKNPKDYDSFLSLCLDIHNRFKVVIHAYSLMPNHYHLMIETPEANLARALRHLNGVYTQGFNQRSKRAGPLFQGRYKAILIEKESYSLELSRYIHLNSVKAKMVKLPEDHEYTSLRYYLGREGKPEFLKTDWLLGQFHTTYQGARKSFQRFTMEGLGDPWSPEEDVGSGVMLGREPFLKKIRSTYLEGKRDQEIPELGGHQSVMELGQIRRHVERCCLEQGLRKRILVWALKNHTPFKLKEIAVKLNYPISYSAVSQICRRLEEDAKKNKKLMTMMTRIQAEMSNVKT